MIQNRLILSALAVVLLPFTLHAQIDLFPDYQGTITNSAITHDGKKIVFLGSHNETQYAVYESVNNGSKWSEPQIIPIFDELLKRSPKGLGGFSFNYDGTQLLFHANIDSTFDIMYVSYKEGKWGEPTKFPSPINTTDDEYSPSISVDNNYIFFLRPKHDAASQKKDLICKEIVLYRRSNIGDWEGPQYIPHVFNVGCQETPFICADGKTFFFSSMRADTMMGGKRVPDDVFNIYYTIVQSEYIYENVWKVPQYMAEFSTEYNDLSPRMNNDASIFIKNTNPRKLSKKQPNRTYQLEVPTNNKPKGKMQLTGKVVDFNTKKPIDAQVVVSDVVTSAVLGEYSADENGKYSIYLNENGNYKIDFHKDGYSHSNHYIKTGRYTKDVVNEFDTTIFSLISFNLNVYDAEMFSPLSPKISVYDSLTNELLIDSLPAVSMGQYKGQLHIGKNYKFHVDCQYFKPQDLYFNTIADVFYNEFEDDIELEPARRIMILDIDAGEEGDSVLVNVKNLSRNETQTVVAKRDKDGNLIVELREGDTYEIDVAKKGYTYSSTKVDVAKSQKTQKINIKLDLLTKDTKMTFNNITFEINSAELNTESFVELNRLIDFLKLNDNVKIELSAHTDDIGSDWYNLALSEKRAQSAVKYLTDNGISESVIIAKGYGETVPILPNISEENRAQNRRIEVKIIE